jgi:hypothetical protein
MEKNEPENTAKTVVDVCSDYDVYRFLLDTGCLSCRLVVNLSIRPRSGRGLESNYN